MPSSTVSQLTNAPSPVLPLSMPANASQWAYFVQRLQDYINYTTDASNRSSVNVVPFAYTVYNGSSLPALTLTGCTGALDSTQHQFGAASLKLTATASTVSVQFYGYPIPVQQFQRWITSVYVLTSRTSLSGALEVITASGTYSVNIGTTLTAAAWARLYGAMDLTADSSTACTINLTLTGCAVGDTFNLEGWQLESAKGNTNLPSPWVNSNPLLATNVPGTVKTFQSGSVTVNTSTAGQVTTTVTLPTQINAAKAIVAISSASAVSTKNAPNTSAQLASNTTIQLITDVAIGGSSYNITVYWQVLEWF